MRTTTASAPSDAWHIAYLITGDRAAARRVADSVLAAPPADVAHLRAEVARRARVEARRLAMAGRHEPLWDAIQRLPRRQRAAIVARLAA
jgi:hypothetical protein